MGIAEFEIIGRVARIVDLSNKSNSKTHALVSVATDQNWKNDAGEWEKKTSFHTLVVKNGSKLVVKDLDVGDLTRFTGVIDTWKSGEFGTDEFKEGVSLIALQRRIFTKAKPRGTADEGPAGHDDNEVPY
ncbi:MAG TPA: single-stranded DNA-binding protein [Rhizomicrobium sp.]|nr:single-stranded DNA-binding protein [Rhizomicrobium sp.]